MRSYLSLFSSILMLSLLLFIFSLTAIGEEEAEQDSTEPEVTVITLYDNYQHNPDLKTAWGFSCLVRAGKENILFDTGADSPTLLANMKKLQIDPKDIDMVVLSHAHGDHTGGLMGMLELNSELTVFLPKSFSNDFKKRVASHEAKVVEVADPMTIHGKVSTTGELGTFIKEQSLIVKTSRGLVVITGCAHPGIVKILKEAKKITGEDIYLVLGGFHLLNLGASELKEVIKDFRDLKVQKAAPSHCSGDKTREMFQEEYGEDFISNGVGKMIRF